MRDFDPNGQHGGMKANTSHETLRGEPQRSRHVMLILMVVTLLLSLSPLSGDQVSLAQDPEATPVPVDLAPDTPDASPEPERGVITCEAPSRAAPALTAPATQPMIETDTSATPVVSGDGISDLDLLAQTDEDTAQTAAHDLGMTFAGVPIGPADAETAADIERVARSLEACLSESILDTVADLTAGAFRGLLVGIAEPLATDEFLEIANLLPPPSLTILSVDDVRILNHGGATALISYAVGNQLRRGRWSFELIRPGAASREAGQFAAADARWVITGERGLNVTAPAGAVAVRVELDEYTIQANPAAVQGSVIALTARNVGTIDHEVLVLRLEDGATTADLLSQPGPALPAGISVVGQVTVAPGEERVLILVDVPPGTYALVDLFPDPSGLPNLALGMEAELTVTR